MQEWADVEFCYLTTTGRRSGRPHTIEMWFGVHGGRLYMLSGGRDASDWIKNVQAEPAVSVRVGDQARAGRARVLEPGTEEDALARQLLVDKYEPIDQSDLTSWGRSSLPVVIELQAL
ncbi:MAG TPA: nitroreductase/quinone reductase family protein [Chloroflexota bacterium]